MNDSALTFDYDALDRYKRQAQTAAQATDPNLRLGFNVVSWTRGESCFLVRTPSGDYLALVEEGLGTKNVAADLYSKQLIAAQMGYAASDSRNAYRAIGKDAVAMIVNDMITLGARPLVVAQHLAVGHNDWFKNEVRAEGLIEGWRRACDEAGCVWGPGETPKLEDIILPEAAVISGSAIGWAAQDHMIKPSIRDGDAIVLLESSGIHANGLTTARKIAEKLPQGYLTMLPGGQESYGQALLRSTHIYVGIIGACLDEGVPLHYAVNITGHGWRKLMRAQEPFVYVIEDPGTPQPIFTFMQVHGPMSEEEAYHNLNMGAGFAVYVPQHQVGTVCQLADRHGFKAWRAGQIEKRGSEKRVIIKPKGIIFDESSLAVR